MGDVGSASAVRGSRNQETRQRNLSLLLSAVHASGQLTRSELTLDSGLNRSTVGALVGDLVEAGLVVETEPRATHQAGRPSPVVRPSPDVVSVSVNPDVSGVSCAAVGLGGVVRMHETVVTPQPPTPEQTATVRVAPHLNWVDVRLEALMEEELALPVRMANDATFGVMAESMFGAGAGSDDVVYFNGSTSGVGGGVVSGGRLVKGVRGFGAELGHTLLNPQGRLCGCGRTGCLETEVNVQRVWAVAGERYVPLDELDHLYADVPSAELGAELDRQADALAMGIASLLSVFAPARVI